MSQGMQDTAATLSTMDSSPNTSGDAIEPIKRPARTYGRRREPLPSAEESALPDSFFGPPDSSFESAPGMVLLESTQTLPPSSPLDHSDVEERPHSEMAADASQPFVLGRRKGILDRKHSDSEEEEDNENAPSKYEFAFKRQIRDIDDNFDEMDKSPSKFTLQGTGKEQKETLFGSALLLQQGEDGTSKAPPSTILPRRAISDDVFTALAPSSPSHDTSSRQTSQSSTVSNYKSRRRLKRVVSSDSEGDDLRKETSSATASVSGQNVFSSPNKARSSSTEPTTDDELPSRIARKPKAPVSKKSNSSRLSVPPLDFKDLPSSAPSSDTKNSKKGRKNKVKAPTKKDQQEIIKERGRLSAQMAVSIPRPEKQSKHTLDNLLRKLSGYQASDPIEPFSSPANRRTPSPDKMALSSPSAKVAKTPSPAAKARVAADIPSPEDSDEEGDLPDMSTILQESKAKSHAEKLRQIKQRALQQQPVGVDEEDDDLVVSRDPKVEVKEEEEHRRSSKSSRPSEARRIVAQLARVPTTKKPVSVSPRKRKDFTAVMKDPSSVASKKELDKLMLSGAREAAAREKRRKEEQWTKYGGQLAPKVEAPSEGFQAALKEIATKGVGAVKSRKDNQRDEDEDEDEGDDDWMPDRGSASPEPEAVEGDEEESDENMEVDADEAETTMVADEGEAMDSEDADTTRVDNVRSSKRTVVVSDSEEDENENDENAPAKSEMERTRQMSTSSGLGTEDENDKENNTKLMYDRSEDKENTRVARHTPLVQRPSIFDLANESMSSPEREEISPRGSRRPFQDLLSEESPKGKQLSPTRLTQSFASKLQASPMPRTLTPAPTLKALLVEGTSNGFGGFSQFSQAGDDVFSAAPLQAGFSDIFDSATEKQQSPSRFGKSRAGSSGADFSDENDASKSGKTSLLQRVDTLDLTQDVAAAVHLQGAFQPAENILNKADAVFEKEQVLMVEANMRKPRREHSELYVNDMGFLTQTKPVDGTPDIYTRPSPVPSSMTMLSPSDARGRLQSQTPRMPLRTISYSGITPSQPDSPEESKSLQRLRRRASDTPPHSTGRISPTASPSIRQPRRHQPPNAFDQLRYAQQKLQKKEEQKRLRTELGDLIEQEADESDDDDFVGWLKKNPAGDGEEDGEDLDQDLKELMDYNEMDDDTVRADKVQEKHMQHQEQDDKDNEALHMRAIQGLIRKRKKNGVSVDDSEEESEDDDNARARRKMKKLRKSERSDIKSLEQNEETRAFANAYNGGLGTDDIDMSFLGDSNEIGDLFPTPEGAAEENGSSEDAEAEQEEEQEPRIIDVHAVIEEVREKAKQGTLNENALDVDDVSWMDQDEDMEVGPRVKHVNTRLRPPPRAQDSMDASELDGPAFRKSTVPANAGSKQWYAQESKSRNGGTARSVGGSAITGHAKAKAKPGVARGSGPTRKATGAPSGGGATKPVRTASSALSVLGDRSGSFA